MRAAQRGSCLTQLLIARPESCTAGQRHRGQQMDIDIPDALAMHTLLAPGIEQLRHTRHPRMRAIAGAVSPPPSAMASLARGHEK